MLAARGQRLQHRPKPQTPRAVRPRVRASARASPTPGLVARSLAPGQLACLIRMTPIPRGFRATQNVPPLAFSRVHASAKTQLSDHGPGDSVTALFFATAGFSQSPAPDSVEQIDLREGFPGPVGQASVQTPRTLFPRALSNAPPAGPRLMGSGCRRQPCEPGCPGLAAAIAPGARGCPAASGVLRQRAPLARGLRGTAGPCRRRPA